MVMVYGHSDSCVLFYLRSTVQYVTFVTNQAEMGNRKEPSNQAMLGFENVEKRPLFFITSATSICLQKGHQNI